MPARRFVVTIVMMVLSVLPCASAEASTVVPMNLEEMVDRSEAVFIGRVLSIRADWNTARTRIYTNITLAAERFLKGGTGSRLITIRVLGGQVGNFRAIVLGSPQFGIGEHVLLFCSGSQASIPRVLGLSMGKFSIVTNARGEEILKRDISSLMLANHRTNYRQPRDLITRYRLADVESHIEDVLR